MDRTRHQGQLLELVAAVGNARRQGVVLALVRKRFLVKRLENDLDLLLEQLATGFLVQHRRAEGLDLAGMVAAADAEDRPAAGQDVGGRKSSARRSGCHIGAMLKAQPIFRFFVTWARCTASIKSLGIHS